MLVGAIARQGSILLAIDLLQRQAPGPARAQPQEQEQQHASPELPLRSVQALLLHLLECLQLPPGAERGVQVSLSAGLGGRRVMVPAAAMLAELQRQQEQQQQGSVGATAEGSALATLLACADSQLTAGMLADPPMLFVPAPAAPCKQCAAGPESGQAVAHHIHLDIRLGRAGGFGAPQLLGEQGPGAVRLLARVLDAACLGGETRNVPMQCEWTGAGGDARARLAVPIAALPAGGSGLLIVEVGARAGG